MIDHRFSRMAFEAQRSHAERNQLARELGEELRVHISKAPDPENGLSAALARLRLIGHHLYASDLGGDRQLYAGDPAGDEGPTGLEIEMRRGTLIEIRYRSKDRR